MARLGTVVRGVAVALLAASVAVSPAAAAASPTTDAQKSLCGSRTGMPAYSHVIVIMDENLSWKNLVSTSGKASAPFINALMGTCHAYKAAGATNPSQPNYMAATQGYIGNASGFCIQCQSTSDNVFRQINRAGFTWRAYEEAMPKPCSGASNTAPTYKSSHNPPYWYTDLGPAFKGGDGSCATFDVPYRLGDGLGTLPSFAWVTPDMCHDMHWIDTTCTIPAGLTKTQARMQAGDQWLQTFLATQVFNRPDYQNGSTLVILTWDEGNEAGGTWYQNCADPKVYGSVASCPVATVTISPYASGGIDATASSAVPSPLYSDYSILRLIQRTLGLSTLAAPSPQPAFWSSYTNAPVLPPA